MSAAVEPTRCEDCWTEALMSVGIYERTSRVPRDKIRAVKEAYEDWFYQSHDAVSSSGTLDTNSD